MKKKRDIRAIPTALMLTAALIHAGVGRKTSSAPAAVHPGMRTTSGDTFGPFGHAETGTPNDLSADDRAGGKACIDVHASSRLKSSLFPFCLFARPLRSRGAGRSAFSGGVAILALAGLGILAPLPVLADQVNPAGQIVSGKDTRWNAITGMNATADKESLANMGGIEVRGRVGAYDVNVIGMGGDPFHLASPAGLILTNIGSITATTPDSDAYGMVGGNNSSQTNTGSITVSSDGGSAFGMYGQNSSLSNSGSITATGDMEAIGLYGLDNCRVTNSGSITAAAGINTTGMAGERSSILSNSGSITVTDRGVYGRRIVYGMSANNNSRLTNSGDITVTATGKDGTAYGMAGEADCSLTNTLTGIITVTATGSGGKAYGMEAGRGQHRGQLRLAPTQRPGPFQCLRNIQHGRSENGTHHGLGSGSA